VPRRRFSAHFERNHSGSCGFHHRSNVVILLTVSFNCVFRKLCNDNFGLFFCSPIHSHKKNTLSSVRPEYTPKNLFFNDIFDEKKIYLTQSAALDSGSDSPLFRQMFRKELGEMLLLFRGRGLAEVRAGCIPDWSCLGWRSISIFWKLLSFL